MIPRLLVAKTYNIPNVIPRPHCHSSILPSFPGFACPELVEGIGESSYPIPMYFSMLNQDRLKVHTPLGYHASQSMDRGAEVIHTSHEAHFVPPT